MTKMVIMLRETRMVLEGLILKNNPFLEFRDTRTTRCLSEEMFSSLQPGTGWLPELLRTEVGRG